MLGFGTRQYSQHLSRVPQTAALAVDSATGHMTHLYSSLQALTLSSLSPKAPNQTSDFPPFLRGGGAEGI